MTGELRDELAEALGRCICPPPIPGENPYDSMQIDCPLHGTSAFRADAVLPVVVRFADAQVAAERERIAAAIEMARLPGLGGQRRADADEAAAIARKLHRTSRKEEQTP